MKKSENSHRRRKCGYDQYLHDYLPGISAADCREIRRSRTVKAALHTDRNLDRWVSTQRLSPQLKVNAISLHAMNGWSVDAVTGNIRHQSEKFFSLTGIKVRHRTLTGEIEWDQPIIDQPEVGILGILVKKIRGVLHFCLQSKEEPGNCKSVQLSPTVQATFSNYTQVHGGRAPKLTEFFLDPTKGRIVFAKLQSEDGGRFLYKSNRNMIVQVDDRELEILPEGFIWVTLRQIVRLLQQDNLVHACTRSILASLLLPMSVSGGAAGDRNGSSPGEIVQWLDDQKAANHFLVKRCNLNVLKEWGMDRDGSFSHEEGRFFRVIGIEVQSSEREVQSWCQPILDNAGTGIIGILTKEENGERYFLLQAKAEPGNRCGVQIGPTVQFNPGNYVDNKKIAKPFLYDEFCNPTQMQLLAESVQSEEGARFYKEMHVHRILALPQGTTLPVPADFRWISLPTVHFLLSMGDMVNSCARSILALMPLAEPAQ